MSTAWYSSMEAKPSAKHEQKLHCVERSDQSADVMVRDIVIGAGGHGFDFQVDQIGHSATNGVAMFLRSRAVQALNRGDEARH